MRRAISFALVGAVSATSPVSKVVELLTAMQKDQETESASDKAAQDKMECWCKDTIGTATATVNESTETIKTKNAEAAAEAGKAAAAATEAKNAEKKEAEEREALEQATALRAKEQADFHKTEKELVESISALKSAITVLSKHNSFLQTGKGINQVAATLQATLPKYTSRHMGEITPSQNKALMSFVAQPSFGAYQSQSGEIFGILRSMLDEFTNDLAEQRETEKTAKSTFAEGKRIKQELIAKNRKTATEKNARARASKAAQTAAEAEANDAEEELQKANTLLTQTQKSCETARNDYKERVTARAQEQEAIAKALEFLNSDEAHALFHSTFSSFIQVKNQKVLKVANKLSMAGYTLRNKDMFSLAQAIKAGAFDKVINAIDKLVKEIDADIKKDAATRSECVDTINKKKSKLNALKNQIEKGMAAKDRLETKKKALTAEIAKLDEEIENAQDEQKKASLNREVENKEFQDTVKDQNASITVLNQALTVLKNVYGASLLQAEPGADGSGFKADGQRATGGTRVLALIKEIINDCQNSKNLAVESENNAQKSYELAMQGLNDMINTKNASKIKKEGKLGETGKELAELTATLKTQTDEQRSQEIFLAAKEQDCKFLFDNFQIRLDHMNQERDALIEAKSFLKGMTAA